MSNTSVEVIEEKGKEEIDVSLRITVKSMNGTKKEYKEELERLALITEGKNDGSISYILRVIGSVI